MFKVALLWVFQLILTKGKTEVVLGVENHVEEGTQELLVEDLSLENDEPNKEGSTTLLDTKLHATHQTFQFECKLSPCNVHHLSKYLTNLKSNDSNLQPLRPYDFAIAMINYVDKKFYNTCGYMNTSLTKVLLSCLIANTICSSTGNIVSYFF